MTDDEAFLRAILESPDDALPRLVFADWLDEHGDPRGEYLRLRHALSVTADRAERHRLEQRRRKLLAAHRGEWVEYLGLPLTWYDAVAVVRRREAEAAAWWRRHGPGGLRAPDLRPPPLTGGADWGEWLWRTPAEDWQEAVNDLANRRAALLAAGGRDPHGAGVVPADGRLLLFDPGGTLRDEAAMAECPAYFDGHNAPAWGTWVFYARERGESPQRWWPFSSYLVAWVPPELVGPVDRGVRFNPEGCIWWAEDADTPLARRLWADGLLG